MDVTEPIAVGLHAEHLGVATSVGQLLSHLHEIFHLPIIGGIIQAGLIKRFLGVEHHHRPQLQRDQVEVAVTLGADLDGGDAFGVGKVEVHYQYAS